MSDVEDNTLCPVCERGKLIPLSDEMILEHKNKTIIVPDTEYSACNHCNADLVIPEQARRNDERIRIAKGKQNG